MPATGFNTHPDGYFCLVFFSPPWSRLEEEVCLSTASHGDFHSAPSSTPFQDSFPILKGLVDMKWGESLPDEKEYLVQPVNNTGPLWLF